MKIDRSHLISVQGADGKKISVVGTSFVYMKDSASPLWCRVKVVVTQSGDNFLLSNADLKNLDLLSTEFLKYFGDRRKATIRGSINGK